MSSIKLKHSGGNTVSLNPPTAAPNPPSGTEIALKLPSTYGSSGEFMQTDGAGNLSFASGTPTNIAQSQLATGVGGKVIKCQYKQWNNVISTTDTTDLGEEMGTSLRMTITPIKSDSLIVYSGKFYIGTPSNVVAHINLQKSSSTDMSSPSLVYDHDQSIAVRSGDNFGNSILYAYMMWMMDSNMQVMEISGSTTARTYSPFWSVSSGTVWNNAYRYTSSEYQYVGTSSILLQEIVI